MKLRSLFMLLVLVAIAGFTVLNWSAILTPTSLNLGVADVQAPLGLIMLGLVVFLIALFLVYVLYLQTTVMFDARANAKELAANRKLADQAEASRFTELRTYLEGEITGLKATNQAALATQVTRIEQVEASLKLAVEQSGNSLAAMLAEIDDRLKR